MPEVIPIHTVQEAPYLGGAADQGVAPKGENRPLELSETKGHTEPLGMNGNLSYLEGLKLHLLAGGLALVGFLISLNASIVVTVGSVPVAGF